MKKSILLSAFCLALCSTSSVFSVQTDDDSKTSIPVKISYSNHVLSPYMTEVFNTASFTLKVKEGDQEETIGNFSFNLSSRQDTAEQRISHSFSLSRRGPWQFLLYPTAEEGQSSYLPYYYSEGTSLSMKQHNITATIDPSTITSGSTLTLNVEASENPELSGDINAYHFARISN